MSNLFAGQMNRPLKEILGLTAKQPIRRGCKFPKGLVLNDKTVLRNTERQDTVDTVNLTVTPWTSSFDFGAAVRAAERSGR